MPKAKQLTAFPGEFSEVQFHDPRERLWKTRKGDTLSDKAHLQHRLICCDCGLAHDFEFFVVKTYVNGDNMTASRGLAPPNYAVQYRVRRNDKSTAATRRSRSRSKT